MDETPAEDAQTGGRVVLTVPFVRYSINVLKTRRIHPLFMAYLHVQQSAALGKQPEWSPSGYVARLLGVPDGPLKKPNYRPFSESMNRQEKFYWMNGNLAGSFAPSSVRDPYRWMLDDSMKSYRLPPDHAQRARVHFLFDEPVPMWAMAGYLLRNCSFTIREDEEPLIFSELSALRPLNSAFNEEFCVTQEMADILFDTGGTDFESDIYEEWGGVTDDE